MYVSSHGNTALEDGCRLIRQDEGNTNFSIILPRLLFTRSHGANLVARAVRERLGVRECTVNERNDVTIRDEEKGKDFKVCLSVEQGGKWRWDWCGRS